MADRPAWSVALQWGVWAVVMAIVMNWLARSRSTERSGAPARGLVVPPGVLGGGGGGPGRWLLLAAVSFGAPTGGPAVSLVFLAFASMGGWMLVDYRVGRHELLPDGLRYGSIRGGGTLRWRELRSVTWSPGMKWFRLETREGRVVRVSAMLTGLPAFAEAVLAQAEPAAIDATTREVLERTALGDLPKIWA